MVKALEKSFRMIYITIPILILVRQSLFIMEGLEMVENVPAQAWASSANNDSLAQMSDICYLFARHVYDVTGIPQVGSWIKE